MKSAMMDPEKTDDEANDEELAFEVRSKSLTEVLSLLYVTIIMIALLLQILFG